MILIICIEYFSENSIVIGISTKLELRLKTRNIYFYYYNKCSKCLSCWSRHVLWHVVFVKSLL